MVGPVDNNYQMGAKIRTPTGEDIPVPDDLVDAVSFEIMRDPIKLPCNHSFDRSYGQQLNHIITRGCPLCRARCDLSQIEFDVERWERIKPLLAKEKPESWNDRVNEIFAGFKLSFKSVVRLYWDYSPNMLSDLRDVASPVYQRALAVQQGRVKGMGWSYMQAELRFVSHVVLAVACLVRDLVASVFFLIGWCFSDRFSDVLAKRISLILATILHTAGLCYWQVANRRMYMSPQMRQESRTLASIENMEAGFSDTVEHINAHMACSLREARSGVFVDFSV